MAGAPSTEIKLNQFQGIWNSVDPFSRSPKGGFRIADNVMFKQPGLVEPRRGFDSFVSLSKSPLSLFCGLYNSLGVGMVQLADRSFYSYISTSADALLPSWSTQAAPFGPGIKHFGQYVIPHPDAGRIRFAQANKNLYAITGIGMIKSEEYTRWVHTQMPKHCAEDPNAQSYGVRAVVTNLATASYNWMSTGYQCAYKVRVVRQGPNGDYVYGEPSVPIKVSNTSGGNRAVQINHNVVPHMTPQSDPAWSVTYPNPQANIYVFTEIFRTKSVPITADLPQDFYKVAEAEIANFTGPELDGFSPRSFSRTPTMVEAAAALPYTDITVDAGLGPPLETNPTDGDTSAAAFAPCPAGADIAWFKNRMYVGNTIDCHRLVLPLTGCGNFGIAAGDTVTVDGMTMTWVIPATGYAYNTPVVVAAAGSVYLNLLASANSLCGALNDSMHDTYNQAYGNGYAALTTFGARDIYRQLRATYIGDASQPGSILLERLVPGAPFFSVTYSSTGTNSYGILSGTRSDSNTQVAGIRYSQEGQPESFPLFNDLTVGDPGKKILRMIATKDSLWIFKEDGLYRLTDDGQGPSISVFDQTIELIAPDSVVALNNEIYCLATQGVLRINEQGKDNLSTPLQHDMLELIAQFNGGSLLYTKAVGCAYETEGVYILSLPESLNAASCTKHYVYFVDGKVWSTYSFGPGMVQFAVDSQMDKLIAATGTNKLWVERKDFTSFDHADPQFTLTLPAAANGLALQTLVFTSVPSPEIHEGDYVYQNYSGVTYGSWVTNVSNDKKTITLLAPPKYVWQSVADLLVLPGITSMLQFLPLVGDPGELMEKTFSEHLRLYFMYMDHPFYDMSVSTDEQPVPTWYSNGRVAAWVLWGTGTGTWGSTLWGEDVTNMVSRSTMEELYARAAELDLTFRFSAANKRFELASVAIGHRESTTDRVVP